jgi:hypothetical protein
MGLLFDDGRDLFDGEMPALPIPVEREVVTTHFAPVFGGLALTFSHGFLHLGFRCAAFRCLFLRVSG